jgi:hypothetical protein
MLSCMNWDALPRRSAGAFSVLMKRRLNLAFLALFFSFLISSCARRPETAPPPPFIPSAPWVSAINQIGFYAFHAEIEGKGIGNRIAAPFETLQILLQEESGENPSRAEILRSIQNSITASKDHAVDLKVKQEEGLRLLEFKGTWAEKFHFKKIKRLSFQTFEGKRAVPMMAGAVYEAYLREENFQAVRLKYGDGKVALYIFLPPSHEKFLKFVKDIDESSLQSWFPQFLERHGEIQLPRFKTSYESNLSGVTRDLGLSYEQLESLKTVFRTDEKGADREAPAPAAEIVGPEKFEMIVDRPFFFVVRDNETELLLLLGIVTNPAEN